MREHRPYIYRPVCLSMNQLAFLVIFTACMHVQQGRQVLDCKYIASTDACTLSAHAPGSAENRCVFSPKRFNTLYSHSSLHNLALYRGTSYNYYNAYYCMWHVHAVAVTLRTHACKFLVNAKKSFFT